MFKSLVILLIAAAINTASFAQAENSLNVVPHWKAGDVHSVTFSSAATYSRNGNTQNYLSTFNVTFVVKEASENGYKLEWTYAGVKLADNDVVIENQIVAKLMNTKLLVQLSDVGKFVELINADEVQKLAGRAVDELIAASSGNPPLNIQFRGAKQLIATKQGLEIALLKQVKMYFLSFGYSYKLNFIQTNNLKYPNPLGGQPFDAVEKVQMTKLDNKNSVCTIETSKVIDPKNLTAAVIEYIKKATTNQQLIDNISKASLEVTESSVHQIDFSKGLVQKGFFKRTMNLGFENRVTVLEMETEN